MDSYSEVSRIAKDLHRFSAELDSDRAYSRLLSIKHCSVHENCRHRHEVLVLHEHNRGQTPWLCNCALLMHDTVATQLSNSGQAQCTALVTERTHSQILSTKLCRAHDRQKFHSCPEQRRGRASVSKVISLLDGRPHWNVTTFLLFASERGRWTEIKSNCTLYMTCAILDA